MSCYDELNYHSGWEGSIEIPSINLALELLEKVRDKQDKGSFENVLLIYKFAKKPLTEDQLLSMSVIAEAYRVGSVLFG
jgi:hypothetical protein